MAVAVTGTIKMRKYPERGEVAVLVVSLFSEVATSNPAPGGKK